VTTLNNFSIIFGEATEGRRREKNNCQKSQRKGREWGGRTEGKQIENLVERIGKDRKKRNWLKNTRKAGNFIPKSNYTFHLTIENVRGERRRGDRNSFAAAG